MKNLMLQFIVIKHILNTFTLALDIHVGPISTNGYSRPNLKVQKNQGT